MTLSYNGCLELSLANVTARDAGVYTVVASNDVGRGESSARVDVIEGKKTSTLESEAVEEPTSEHPTIIEPKREIP